MKCLPGNHHCHSGPCNMLSNQFIKDIVYKELSQQVYQFRSGIEYKEQIDKEVQAFQRFIEGDKDEVIDREVAGQFNTLNHHLGYLNAIDKLVTQDNGEVTVNGHTRKTMAQIEIDAADSIHDLGEEFRETNIKSIETAIGQIGFITIDSFELGATLTQRNQALRHAADGKLYRWAGNLPKVVPASSTPTTSGGMGANAWLEVSDAALRQELANNTPSIGGGASLVNGAVISGSTLDAVTPSGSDNLRNSITSLVKGSTFEWDAVTKLWSAIGTVNVRALGVPADGLTDATAKINAVLSKYKDVYFPEGTYLIDPVDPNSSSGSHYNGGMKFRSDSYIRCHPNAKFIMKPTDKGSYVLANISNVENVTIEQMLLTGDVQTHIGSDGEWGLGFFVQQGAKNINLIRCEAHEMWGDGFLVGGQITVNGGCLFECKAYKNRRQGLSVNNWDNGVVYGGDYSDTGHYKATAPTAGIDIEPDPLENSIINVKMYSPRVDRNKGGGLLIVPGFMSTAPNPDAVFNLNVYDIQMDSNGPFNGVFAGLNFSYPGLNNPTNVNITKKIQGKINIVNPVITNSTGSGIGFSRWIKSAPNVTITNPLIINANNGTPPTNPTMSAIAFDISSDSEIEGVGTGKVDIINPIVNDTRAVAKTIRGLWLQGQSATNRISNFNVYDIETNGLTGLQTTQRLTENCSIEYSKTKTVYATAAANIASNEAEYSGMQIEPSITGGDGIVELSGVNNAIGQVMHFATNRGGGVLGIRTAFGEPINIRGYNDDPDAGKRQVRLYGKGAYLSLKSNGVSWDVVRMSPSGVIASETYTVSNSNATSISYAAEPPTVSTWVRGDIIYNSLPTVGGHVGWVCITSGKPGTWQPFGKIGIEEPVEPTP